MSRFRSGLTRRNMQPLRFLVERDRTLNGGTEGMRKVFHLLVVICCLLVLCASFSPALAESQGVEELFTENSPSKAALDAAGVEWIKNKLFVEDTCYLYTSGEAVYTYTSEAGLTKYCQLPPRPEALDHDPVIVKNINMDELHNMVNWMVAGEDGLYGYNYHSGKFGRVDESGIHWSDVKVDFSPLFTEDGFFPSYVRFVALCGDKLFLYVFDEEGGGPDGLGKTLYGFDLITGKAAVYGKNIDITNMCRGKDGTILYTRMKDGQLGLFQLDASTQEETPLPLDPATFTNPEKLGGLAYRPQGDTICFHYDGTLYQRSGDGDFQTVTLLPSNRASAGDPGWILPNGRYAFLAFLDGGILVCPMSGETGVTHQLTYMGYAPQAEEQFRQSHPDVVLRAVDQVSSTEELVQRLVNQDDSVDVFSVPVDVAFHRMVKKGFVGDLSASPVLQERLAQMDQRIAGVITDDAGRLVAFPAEMYLNSPQVHRAYWAMVFGDAPIPTTLNDILDSWILYEQSYADEYPDLDFLSHFDYPAFLQSVIQFYIRQHDGGEQVPNLQDPALLQVLEKVKQVRDIRVEKGRPVDGTDPDVAVLDGVEQSVRGSIFSLESWAFPMMPASTAVNTLEDRLYGSSVFDTADFLLSFDGTDAPLTEARMQVLVVNPHSKHQADALAFIETFAGRDINPRLYYALYPGETEPLPDPQYEERLAQLKGDLADTEEALKHKDRLSAEEISDYEAWLVYYQQKMANAEELKWEISPTTLARGRQVMEHLAFHLTSLYLDGEGSAADGVFKELCKQTAQDAMTLPELLTNLETKMNMMAMES